MVAVLTYPEVRMLHDHLKITLLIDAIRILIGYTIGECFLTCLLSRGRLERHQRLACQPLVRLICLKLYERIVKIGFQAAILPNALHHGETSSKIVHAGLQDGW